MVDWIITKALAWLLQRIGIKSSLATALVPIVMRTLREARAAIDMAKAEGASDNEALNVAAQVILPPDHPDRPVTLEDIQRGNNWP